MSQSSMQSRISVAVRVRGLNTDEIDDGAAFYVVDNTVVCNSGTEATSLTTGISRAPTGKAYSFDKVFNEAAGNSDVYDNSVASLVPRLFGGYNVTILAYGQTGSGKTHTMGTNFTGEERDEQLGVIPLVSRDILEKLCSDSSTTTTKESVDAGSGKAAADGPRLTGTFVELYNEVLRDLLLPENMGLQSTGLQLVKDSFGNYVPKGATEMELKSMDDLAHILRLGAARRATGSTKMNANSSRSHAVFTLKLEQWVPATSGPTDADGSARANPECTDMVKKVSLFRLVDLAGSERVGQTGASGMRLKEGANINKSLQCLGQCIVALADGAPHVPFRNSKLTQLLMNSLGGNSATVMIACVSPANRNFSQSLNTLDYATRASRIVNKLSMNVDPTAALTMELRSEVSMLVDELTRLYASGAPVSQPVLERFNIGGAGSIHLPAGMPAKKLTNALRPRSAEDGGESSGATSVVSNRAIMEAMARIQQLEGENLHLRSQSEDATQAYANAMEECERLRIHNEDLQQSLRESQAVVGDYWLAVTLIRKALNKENGDAEALSTEVKNFLCNIKHHPTFGISNSPTASTTVDTDMSPQDSDEAINIIQRQEQEILRLRQELFEAQSIAAMPASSTMDDTSALQFDDIDIDAIARGEFQFVGGNDALFGGHHSETAASGNKRATPAGGIATSAPPAKRLRKEGSLPSVSETTAGGEDDDDDDDDDAVKEDVVENSKGAQSVVATDLRKVKQQLQQVMREGEDAKKVLASMIFGDELTSGGAGTAEANAVFTRLLCFPSEGTAYSDEDRLVMASELDKQRRAAALQADNHNQQALEKQALIEAKEREVAAVQEQVRSNGGRPSDALHKKLQDLEQEIRSLKAERLRLVRAAEAHEERAQQIKALQEKLTESRAQQVKLQKELRDKQDLSRKEREEGKRLVQKSRSEVEKEKTKRIMLERTVQQLQAQLSNLAARFVAARQVSETKDGQSDVRTESHQSAENMSKNDRKHIVSAIASGPTVIPGSFSEATHKFTVAPISEAEILMGDTSIPRSDAAGNSDKRAVRREPFHYTRRKIIGGRRVAALTHRLLWFRVNERKFESELERVSTELQDISAEMRSLPSGDASLLTLSQQKASLQAKREGIKADLLALRDAERAEGLDDGRWLSKLIGASRPRYVSKHLDALWARADHLPAGSHVNMAQMHISPQPREIVTYLMNALIQLSVGYQASDEHRHSNTAQPAAMHVDMPDEEEIEEALTLDADDACAESIDIQPDVAARVVCPEGKSVAAEHEKPRTSSAVTEEDWEDVLGDEKHAKSAMPDRSRSMLPPPPVRSSIYVHTQSSRAKARQDGTRSSVAVPRPPSLKNVKAIDENSDATATKSKTISNPPTNRSTTGEDGDDIDIFPQHANAVVHAGVKRSFGSQRPTQ